MSGDPNDLLKSSEVADMLRCESRKALRLLGNEIPAAFDGYRWLARRKDVEAYLDARTETNRSGKNRKRGRGRRAA